MKLKNWLKPLDTPGLYCNIYVNYTMNNNTVESELEYAGSMWDIPYRFIDYEIGYCKIDEDAEGLAPVFYAQGLEREDGTRGDKNVKGFVINLRGDL